MEPESKKYLFDILESIDVINSHLAGIKSLSDYENDLKTIDAVERRLAIVGEALSKSIKTNPLITVSNQRKIIGLRHIIIHNYDITDNSTIWTIVQKHLPVLKKEVELLLKN